MKISHQKTHGIFSFGLFSDPWGITNQQKWVPNPGIFFIFHKYFDTMCWFSNSRMRKFNNTYVWNRLQRQHKLCLLKRQTYFISKLLMYNNTLTQTSIQRIFLNQYIYKKTVNWAEHFFLICDILSK